MHSSFSELKKYLASKSGMRMSHVYKPAMLLAVLRRGGKATKEEIAKDFVLRDQSQIDFYRKTIVHQMPGQRLVRDELLSLENDMPGMPVPVVWAKVNVHARKLTMSKGTRSGEKGQH